MKTAKFQEAYLEALGVRKTLPVKSQPITDESEVLNELLSRAHETRKFEIELYWKRATYFWAFQAVAFAGSGLLFKDGNIPHKEWIVVPALIGAITAFAGYLTARGSKFWQENWEAHVDMLEAQLHKRLTSVILTRGPLEPSVSRVNQSLMLIFAIIWLIPILDHSFPEIELIWRDIPVRIVDALPLLILATSTFVLWRRRTNLRGQSFQAENGEWNAYPGKRENGSKWRIIRRESACDDFAGPTSSKS